MVAEFPKARDHCHQNEALNCLNQTRTKYIKVHVNVVHLYTLTFCHSKPAETKASDTTSQFPYRYP